MPESGGAVAPKGEGAHNKTAMHIGVLAQVVQIAEANDMPLAKLAAMLYALSNTDDHPSHLLLTQPAEVVIKNTESITVSIDDDSLDKIGDAMFEGLLRSRHADKVDRWDYISKTKYGGTGWMDLARAELKQQKDKDGKPKLFNDKDATSYSHVIRRAVEARREDMAQGKKQND
jgi:hypothetical protein